MPTLDTENGKEAENEKRNLRAPDVSFIRADRLKTSKRDFVELVPDLMVEIKSKSDCIKPLVEKIQLFLQLGCTVGIMIDPDKLTLTVYRLNQEPIVLQDKLLCIQLALSGRARLRRERSVERCPPHNHIEKILMQIKSATA